MHLHIHTAKHTHHIIIGICLSPLYSFIMEKVDLVIVGAEGVAESGGVINKVYTFCTLCEIPNPVTPQLAELPM